MVVMNTYISSLTTGLKQQLNKKLSMKSKRQNKFEDIPETMFKKIVLVVRYFDLKIDSLKDLSITPIPHFA